MNEEQAVYSQTFAMIKPDATIRGFTAVIKTDIENAGFEIIEYKACFLTREEAEWLYREHKGRAHFNDLIEYTVSADVELLLLRMDGPNCVSKFRELMGPTDRTKAGPNTIRGKYALETRLCENSVHGSDSNESAKAEINKFFPIF